MFNSTENLVIYSAGINSVGNNRVNTGTINYEIFGIIKHLPIKVNNNNTRKRCEIYSELTIKTPEQYGLLGYYSITAVNSTHVFC